MKIYVYPHLGQIDLGVVRLIGGGLGNLLFPWARAQLLAKKHSLPLIEPTWPNIRIGSIIRRESDYRFYFDLFSKQADTVGGIQKLKLLMSAIRVTEELALPIKNNADTIIVVKGLNGYYRGLEDDQEFLFKTLVSITRENHRAGLLFDFSNSIVMHVRRGDFNVGGIITSIDWFVNILISVRQGLGKPIKAFIFSDGTDTELAPLTALSGVERIGFGSSVADLLAMSRAPIFVGSRHSTFSMWSSFFGRMPSLWPTQDCLNIIPASDQLHIVTNSGIITSNEVKLISSSLS